MPTYAFSETEYLVHITREGDRWDLLALDYYGDARLYEPLIRANRQHFPASFFAPPAQLMTPGLRLRIPLITGTLPEPALSDEVRPPWRSR